MKKFLIALVLSLSLMGSVKAIDAPKVTNHEKIKVYLFYGNNCPHCHDLLTELNENYEEYSKYMDVVALETWNNTANNSFLQETFTDLEVSDNDKGVPFMVVNGKYLVGAKTEELLEEVYEAYQNKNYKDTFSRKLAKAKDVKTETFEEALLTSGLAKPDVSDHEKIKVYLFYGNDCPHCHELLTYFQEHKEEVSPYMEIVALETWENDTNNEALSRTFSAFEIDSNKRGVPFTVINGSYVSGNDPEGILSKVYQAYYDENYEDTFPEFLNQTKDVSTETFEEALVTSGIEKAPGSIPDGLVIGIIIVVLVGGLGGLFYLARKK